MLFEFFYKDCTNDLCTGTHKRIRKHEGQKIEFHVCLHKYLDSTKHNEINVVIITCQHSHMKEFTYTIEYGWKLLKVNLM